MLQLFFLPPSLSRQEQKTHVLTRRHHSEPSLKRGLSIFAFNASSLLSISPLYDPSLPPRLPLHCAHPSPLLTARGRPWTPFVAPSAGLFPILVDSLRPPCAHTSLSLSYVPASLLLPSCSSGRTPSALDGDASCSHHRAKAGPFILIHQHQHGSHIASDETSRLESSWRGLHMVTVPSLLLFRPHAGGRPGWGYIISTNNRRTHPRVRIRFTQETKTYYFILLLCASCLTNWNPN